MMASGAENTGQDSRREWWITGGLLLLGLVSRALARPASLWEWDDIDFARAIHDFDLTAHRPHPPGFPVFVALAKLSWLVFRSDHPALFAVNYLFAALLGVVLYGLFRELLPERRLALGAAVLGLFAPTLWVHSGIARTDNPSLVVGMATLWLLLRGRRSKRALYGGALLLGLGMGIRVTIVPLTGAVLALVLLERLRQREWQPAVVASGLILLGVAVWLLPLLHLTGWEEYRRLMQVQSAYINEHDPIWSRYWTLEERFHGYFVRIWGARWIMWSIYGAAAIGVIALLWQRHWRNLAWLAAAFVPFIAFTVIYNTPMGVVVYSMPYVPLFTGLAAVGLISVGQRGSGAVAVTALALGMAWWSQPLVDLLRKAPSPPVAAAEYLRKRFDPGRDRLYFDELLLPHATYFFDDSRIEEWRKDEHLALNLIDPEHRAARQTFLLSTQPLPGLPRLHFHWPDGEGRDRLRPLSIGRYFDVYVTELNQVRNLDRTTGWYEVETSGLQSWQWMGGRGEAGLFNEADEMRLRLRGRLPAGNGPLEVRVDGQLVGQLRGEEVELTTRVTIPPDRVWSQLTLTSNRTIVPRDLGQGDDQRQLGFQCFTLSWEGADGAVKRRFTAEQFLGEGWGPLEVGRPRSWRWAESRANLILPVLPGRSGRLRMIILNPVQSDGSDGSDGRGETGEQEATIRLTVNGRLIDSFKLPTEQILTRDWKITVDRCPPTGCQLVLETDRASARGAFKVTSLTWTPSAE